MWYVRAAPSRFMRLGVSPSIAIIRRPTRLLNTPSSAGRGPRRSSSHASLFASATHGVRTASR
jgi:hypothetical protein